MGSVPGIAAWCHGGLSPPLLPAKQRSLLKAEAAKQGWRSGVTSVMHLQVDTMQGSVEAAQQIASKVAQPSTATGRLGAAVQQDNDRFLGSEQERQQMVMR